MAEQDTAQLEARAREIGWRPQEEFKGDPEKWVDASEYLRRGEEVLPLVKAENRRLHEKTDKLSTEIQRLTAALAEQRQSMDDMAKFNLEQLQAKLEEQRKQLKAELRTARREEDNDDRVEELEEALEANEEARGKLKTVKQTPAPAAAPAQPTPVETPEYKAWIAANPWFGGSAPTDEAKTAAAQRFGLKAAAAGKRGQDFFDEVDRMMKEAYPDQQSGRRQDPTEDGRPSGTGRSSSSGNSGFNALPADAKAKAREQSSRFVGANKMFKTEQAWFDYYAKQYNMEA